MTEQDSRDPQTGARTYGLDSDAGRELHQRIHPNLSRCPMLDGEPCIWQRRVAAIESQVREQALAQAKQRLSLYTDEAHPPITYIRTILDEVARGAEAES